MPHNRVGRAIPRYTEHAKKRANVRYMDCLVFQGLRSEGATTTYVLVKMLHDMFC